MRFSRQYLLLILLSAVSFVLCARGARAETCTCTNETFTMNSVTDTDGWDGCTPSADDTFRIDTGCVVRPSGTITFNTTSSAGFVLNGGTFDYDRVRDGETIIALGPAGVTGSSGTFKVRGYCVPTYVSSPITLQACSDASSPPQVNPAVVGHIGDVSYPSADGATIQLQWPAASYDDIPDGTSGATELDDWIGAMSTNMQLMFVDPDTRDDRAYRNFGRQFKITALNGTNRTIDFSVRTDNDMPSFPNSVRDTIVTRVRQPVEGSGARQGSYVVTIDDEVSADAGATTPTFAGRCLVADLDGSTAGGVGERFGVKIANIRNQALAHSISSISTTTDEITTSAAHGLISGARVDFTDISTTPQINATEAQIVVTSATTYFVLSAGVKLDITAVADGAGTGTVNADLVDLAAPLPKTYAENFVMYVTECIDWGAPIVVGSFLELNGTATAADTDSGITLTGGTVDVAGVWFRDLFRIRFQNVTYTNGRFEWFISTDGDQDSGDGDRVVMAWNDPGNLNGAGSLEIAFGFRAGGAVDDSLPVVYDVSQGTFTFRHHGVFMGLDVIFDNLGAAADGDTKFLLDNVRCTARAAQSATSDGFVKGGVHGWADGSRLIKWAVEGCTEENVIEFITDDHPNTWVSYQSAVLGGFSFLEDSNLLYREHLQIGVYRTSGAAGEIGNISYDKAAFINNVCPATGCLFFNAPTDDNGAASSLIKRNGVWINNVSDATQSINIGHTLENNLFLCSLTNDTDGNIFDLFGAAIGSGQRIDLRDLTIYFDETCQGRSVQDVFNLTGTEHTGVFVDGVLVANIPPGSAKRDAFDVNATQAAQIEWRNGVCVFGSPNAMDGQENTVASTAGADGATVQIGRALDFEDPASGHYALKERNRYKCGIRTGRDAPGICRENWATSYLGVRPPCGATPEGRRAAIVGTN